MPCGTVKFVLRTSEVKYSADIVPKAYFTSSRTKRTYLSANAEYLVENPCFRKGFLVDGDGFEPSKSLTADLQSAPFGRSGTHPYMEPMIGVEPTT